MSDLIGQWYIFLSQISYALYGPVNGWIDALQIPILSALLFGLLGALSPCQITGNLSAAAYAVQRPGDTGFIVRSGLSFAAGKMLAYAIFGALALALGSALEAKSIPYVITYRRILGPVFILAGLYFLGVFSLRFQVGGGLSRKLLRALPNNGALGAGFLGFAVSFSFCPTLFLLFFSWVLPLSLKSPGGALFPVVFGLGTATPLLVVAGVAAAGGTLAEGWALKLTKWNRPFRRVAGAVFLLAGINDTLIYNFM